MPDLLIKGSRTYRYITDHLGSVRLLVDTLDGTIAQRIDYGPFGRVLYDSNPGFQPFGYAGGIADRHTGLVRFGARDYDPIAGRWTARDPLGFGGRSSNLYTYVDGDPINRLDPSGLAPASGRMAECLEEIFGESVADIDVRNKKLIKNQWITTRPNSIRLPPDYTREDFFSNPALVLHEYFHVIRQWRTGKLSKRKYAMEFLRNGAEEGNRFEDEASEFAENNLGEFTDCLEEDEEDESCSVSYGP